jgi:predicted aspartyl protease
MDRAFAAPNRPAFAVRSPAMRTLNSRRAAAALATIAALMVVTAAPVAAAPDSPDPPPTGTRLDPLRIEIGSDDALYAAPTTLDRIGRIMAPVMINGQGPFRFIVDTGASRSAISPRVLERLGLVASTDAMLTIHGVTGTGLVPSVLIEELRAGDIVLHNRRIPVIEPHVFADADGILGVEGFTGMRIKVDFTTDRIEISSARRKAMGGDWARVPVKLRFGRLMVGEASIGSVKVKAVIDTGAERTLGNLALRKALDLDAKAHAEGTARKIFGAATADPEAGNSLRSPIINLGHTGIRRLEVTYADLNVFKIWGLEKEPALVVGMDVLGTVRSIVFDYRRSEILLIP